MSMRTEVMKDQKQRELIAAVHTSFFQNHPAFRGNPELSEEARKYAFIPSNNFDWLHDARGQLILGERRSLELNTDYRQLLPYVILRSNVEDEPHYFIYQRVKHTNETRLAGNTSMGLGGHIDITDMAVFQDNNGIVDWETVITLNARRELVEETKLSIFNTAEIEPIGIILDDSEDNGAVGKVHVGLVCIIDVDGETVQAMTETMNTDEAEAKYVGFFSVQELREDIGSLDPQLTGKLEPWSKILLDCGIM